MVRLPMNMSADLMSWSDRSRAESMFPVCHCALIPDDEAALSQQLGHTAVLGNIVCQRVQNCQVDQQLKGRVCRTASGHECGGDA